jgi:hypothetical protein
MTLGRRSAAVLALVFGVAFAACGGGDGGTPAPTLLDITTTRTVCGGAVPPPGEPPCRTSPISRAVAVSREGTVVASGTTGADGMLLLEVPAGELVVSAPDAPGGEICDTPAITTVQGQTTSVTQNCTLLAP